MNQASSQARASTMLQERALYASWGLFWLLMAVVELQDAWHSQVARWEPFLWIASAAIIATLWFVTQRRLDRRMNFSAMQPHQWFWFHLKWLPAIMLTMIPGMYAIRHATYAAVGRTYEHESWLFVAIYESIKLSLFFALWLGILFAFNAFRNLQEQRQHLLLLQKSFSEARLAQLKAQLRPHFFFNVLNTISSLMHIDVERADRLLSQLADLLRSSLAADEQELVSLEEELRLLQLYAQIMQSRFADRVLIEWRIDEEVGHARVPMMVAQPLLENAFKHGVEPTIDPVTVQVRAAREGANVVLEIRNSGVLAADSEGVGLRNCRERLAVLYEGRAQLRLEQDGGYVSARILLPHGASVS